MPIFDDLTKKAAKFTEEAIDKTQELAEIAKLKLRIKNLETDREDVYKELGQYYFELIKDENSVDEVVADMRQRIDDYSAQIEEIKRKIDEEL